MHKALRPFKVTGLDGKVRTVKPGDDVPEAKTWKNTDIWIRRRWITDAEGNTYDGRHFVSGRKVTIHAGGPSEPGGVVGPMRGGSRPKPAPAIAPTPAEPKAPEPAPAPSPTEPKSYNKAELRAMSKADVVSIAESMGLASDGTKDAVIDAILEVQSG